MRLTRSTSSSVLASAALLAAPFSTASAIERNLLTWTSRVDREVIIQIRGRDVATRGSGMDAQFSPRVNINQTLPRAPGIVRAYLENGRGDVDVLEHPSARNNYTASIWVRDARAGQDAYRVVVMYETNDGRDNGGYGNNNGNGRGNGNGNGSANGNGKGRGNGGPWDRDNRGEPRDDRNRDDRDRNDRDRDDRDRDNRNGGSNVDYDRNRRDAGALRWSGLVDGVAEIRIQGGRVDAISPRGDVLRSVRYNVVGSSLPRRDVRLELGRSEGRGAVRIAQQPSVWNQYTAVIRIDDSASGYGSYAFDVRW